MEFKVEISPTALKNAKSYYQHIEKDSQKHALHWYQELLRTIATLERLPHRYALAPESKFIDLEIRHCIYQKRYRILYTIHEDTVRIHHIRHTSQPLMKKVNFIF